MPAVPAGVVEDGGEGNKHPPVISVFLTGAASNSMAVTPLYGQLELIVQCCRLLCAKHAVHY